MSEDKFESIYGDAESEFEVEDVSDETTSISTEEIVKAIEEENEAAEEAASVAEEPAAEKEPEAPDKAAPADHDEPEAEAGEASASVDHEEPADDTPDGITFEDPSVRHDDETAAPVYGAAADEDSGEDNEENDDHVSVISYILHAILFTIPVIGTILMLVYIISDKKNVHLRHFAQIWLITLLIIAIGIYAAVTILGIA